MLGLCLFFLIKKMHLNALNLMFCKFHIAQIIKGGVRSFLKCIIRDIRRCIVDFFLWSTYTVIFFCMYRSFKSGLMVPSISIKTIHNTNTALGMFTANFGWVSCIKCISILWNCLEVQLKQLKKRME